MYPFFQNSTLGYVALRTKSVQMSIALIGPTKYDFQDLVCIYLVLNFYHEKSLTFKVEPRGGEDAELCFIKDGIRLKFEVQVKGSEEPVTTQEFSKWLMHFSEHSSKNFLLKRAFDSSDSHIVIISSGRSTDLLQKYIVKRAWQGRIHPVNKFTESDASDLINYIRGAADPLGSTKLKKKRAIEILGYCDETAPKTLKAILNKILLLDQIDEEFIIEQCRKILRKNFNIPDDRFHDVMGALKILLKECKTNQTDLVPKFKDLICSLAIQSFRPRGYVLRNQEDDWRNQLSRENVLLLSGKPRVGKSHTANWIAAYFQEQGYSILPTSRIEDADRFLSDIIETPRLVILDDPLGSTKSENAYDLLKQLKLLARRTKSTRKLIIAQGQERLLELSEVTTLDDAKLDKFQWIDLGLYSREFQIAYWDSLKTEFGIPDHLYNKVKEALERQELSLEPGCLTYLAVEHSKLNSDAALDQISRFSRIDASGLGNSLVQDGCKEILMGLAIATGNQDYVDENHLAYLLKGGSQSDYGISKFFGTGFSLGQTRSVEKSPLPTYEKIPNLTPDDDNAIELLEVRRMIEVTHSSRINFTHPFYRSAAESCFSFATSRATDKIIQLLNRGVFCLSPGMAKSSARNILWLYQRAPSIMIKQKIINVAIKALDSAFPSVRDICFEFLLNIDPSFLENHKEELSSWIYKVRANNLVYLNWYNGNPWYPIGDNITLERDFSFSSKEDFDVAFINAVNLNAPINITSEDAYKCLVYFKNNAEKMTNKAVARLLSIDEGLIRALTVKIWLSVSRKKDREILNRIFEDRHPAVAESILKALIQSWKNISTVRRKNLLNGLNAIASNPVNAISMIETLIVFERPEYTSSNPPWIIFTELLPTVLDSLPRTHAYNTARLANVITVATDTLPHEKVLPIIDKWISHISRCSIDSIPDDYSMCVTSLLVQLTADTPNLMTFHVGRLLSLHGTGAVVRVISDLMKHWFDVGSEVRSLVKDFLKPKRQDDAWIKAAILTAEVIPHELLDIAMEKKSLGILNADDILRLEPKLLSAGLKMYTGNPQPLWWIGTHHRNQSLWPKVIEIIGIDAEHQFFELAFDELLRTRNIVKITEAIEQSPVKNLQKIFELMMREKISTSGEFMAEIWKALLDAATLDVRIKWIYQMAIHSNIILDSLDEAKDWIAKDYLEEFYSHFPIDFALMKLCETIYHVKDALESPETKLRYLQIIRSIFRDGAPSHYGTCQSCHEFMKILGYTADEISFIEDKRIEILESSRTVDNFPNEKLVDWIY